MLRRGSAWRSCGWLWISPGIVAGLTSGPHRAREKGRHRDRAALSGLSFQAKQDAAGSGTVMPQ
jgi:hypothetical protein